MDATGATDRKRVEISREISTASETMTMMDAAKEIGVSFGSVQRARAIRNHGTEAHIADVISDEQR